MSTPTTIWEATLTGAHGNIILSNVYKWDGAQFRLRDIDGWFGGVGVANEMAQRVLGHGFFERDGYRTGRTITLVGVFYFESDADRHIAARYLSGLLWDGLKGTLRVVAGDSDLSAEVRLDGQPDIVLPRGEHVIKLSVPMVAADPFLYAPACISQIFPAGSGQGLAYPLFTTKTNVDDTPVLDWGMGAPLTAALGNEGNATAYPTITVHGSWPAGFSIVESGRTLTYSSAVVSSTPVVIDNQTGSVTIGGVDQTYKLTSRDWFSVEPGESFMPHIAALAPSNGWADISISSTYI